MKESLAIISFAFIFLLSLSIVSAGFWDWLTGDATNEKGIFSRFFKSENPSISSSTESGCCVCSDAEIWTESNIDNECEKWAEAEGCDEVFFDATISEDECGAQIDVNPIEVNNKKCIGSCQYILAKDILAQGDSIQASEACVDYAENYVPAGIVNGEKEYLYSDEKCKNSIFESSSDEWFSIKSADTNPLLTTITSFGSCVASKPFSFKEETQKYKGVLCCSQTCGVILEQDEGNKCADSDGGSNLLIKGNVIDSSGKTGTDSCTEDNRNVIEFVCEGDNIASKTITCEKGCKDGICVN